MNDKLIIAKILKPQGIGGQIKVLPLTDRPEDLLQVKKVEIGGKEYQVLAWRITVNGVFFNLRGIADRNGAEGLRGKDILCQRTDFAIEEDRYFISDLIDMTVLLSNGKIVGKVVDIRTAHTDVYTVKNDNGKDILFPSVKGLIVNVDMDNSQITLDETRFNEVAVYED